MAGTSESELTMWRQILVLCLLWAPVDLAADVVIRADGVVTPIRKTKPPVLLQAKATLKRPDHHTVEKPSKGEAGEETQGLPLSFLQEEETARATSVTKTASADEFLTEVLPMAGPSLPVQTKVAATTTSPETFQVLSLILLVSVTLVAASFYRRPRDRVTQQVESLPILLGSDLTSQSQTGLVRLEGHVVLDGSKDALTAPFSEKTCVFYSASVSHPRHDEIRQPPVAFNTKQTKFCVELQDAPEIRVQVAGDVSLFNMQTGQEEWQHAFTEAPKNWCSFVLNHLVASTDAGTHFKKCLDLGSDGVFLDFREAALLLGSHVCCVGQVEKDAEGRWSLRPWQPPAGQSKRWSAASAMWRRKDCLAGSILISDNPDLHA